MFFFFSGPVVAEAMFVNREEIPVQSIYRDPVSDFYDYIQTLLFWLHLKLWYYLGFLILILSNWVTFELLSVY